MNEYIATVNNKKSNISVLSNSEVSLNGSKFIYEIISLGYQSYLFRLDDKIYELTAVKGLNDSFQITLGGYQFEVTVRTALQEKAFKLIEEARTVSHHLRNVKAPMPGLILKLKKKENEMISQGDSVIILEAMKMENDLRAPASGQIKKIFVSEGTAVEKGTILFTIE